MFTTGSRVPKALTLNLSPDFIIVDAAPGHDGSLVQTLTHSPVKEVAYIYIGGDSRVPPT